MSTTDILAAPTTHVSSGRLLTIADVDRLPTSLPSGDVHYELNNGRLIIVSPPGRRHGKTHMRLGAFFDAAEKAGLGEGFIETGVVLWRNPDRLVGADGAFVSRNRCPVRETKEGYLETIPDLAVEIRSKDDTLAELRDKAGDYLKAGVRVVWVIDPILHNATVYQQNQSPETIAGDGVLADATILGDLKLELANLLKP